MTNLRPLFSIIIMVALSGCTNFISLGEKEGSGQSEPSLAQVASVHEAYIKEGPVEIQWETQGASNGTYEVRGCSQSLARCSLLVSLSCQGEQCQGTDYALSPPVPLLDHEIRVAGKTIRVSLTTVHSLAQTGSDWVEVRAVSDTQVGSWSEGLSVTSLPEPQ